MMKEFPYTYDMTFCVSKCKEKCYRHIDHYSFEVGRPISMADFNCEGKKDDRTIKKELKRRKNE